MKQKMPAFLEKKKRNPASTNPAKNTKGYSVAKSKSKKETDSEQDRGRGNMADAPPNKAQRWLDQAQKPRNRNGSY